MTSNRIQYAKQQAKAHPTDGFIGCKYKTQNTAKGNRLIMFGGYGDPPRGRQDGSKLSSKSEPKDKTREAYKAWILEFIKPFRDKSAVFKWTDAEWIESWKRYWEGRSQR
jgi:hypothetical protein